MITFVTNPFRGVIINTMTCYRVSNSELELLGDKKTLLLKSKKFNPRTGKGGFNLCEIHQVVNFLNSKKNGWIYESKIIPGTNTFHTDETLRAEMIEITRPIQVSEFIRTHRLETQAVMKNGLHLRLIVDQTDEIRGLAIDQNSRAIKYDTVQSESMCLRAVKKDGMVLRHIFKPTLRVCYEAVQNNINAIILAPIKYRSKIIDMIKNTSHQIDTIHNTIQYRGSDSFRANPCRIRQKPTVYNGTGTNYVNVGMFYHPFLKNSFNRCIKYLKFV